jgi:hypothetical protein
LFDGNVLSNGQNCCQLPTALKIFLRCCPKDLASGKEIHNLSSNVGIIIKKIFVTAVTHKRIWYRYGKVTRATLLFTLLCLCNCSNVTDTIILGLWSGNDVTYTNVFAPVTVTK